MCSPFRGAAALAASCVIALFNPAAHADIQFTDVTAQSGLPSAKTPSYGLSMADVDGDGWVDLFLNNHARKHSILFNRRDGTFRNVLTELDAESFWRGPAAWQDTHGGSWIDYDNDGDQDLLVTTGNCCDPQFMVNIGGKLYNRTVALGFGNDADKGGRMPVWFDSNRDGRLEMVFATLYGTSYFGQSNGIFVNALAGTGFDCANTQFGMLIDLDAERVL